MPAVRAEQEWWTRGSEWTLAVVASLALLGWLGSTELWGKREQRAAAEALDTVNHGHWLVGQIQGRPRLEKPPLPRWITAGVMAISGRRDEVAVRLPSALAALAVIGLVVAWGRAGGGRSVGLAAGFALASTPFFVVELRQAGNDGLLTLFATLSLFAAARRWGIMSPDGQPGPSVWGRVFWSAIGLGFLCKGPVIALWVGVPIGGFLITQGQVRAGLRLLANRWGVLIGLILVVVWPVAVAVRYPAAPGVWWLEMGQKTGALAIEHGNARGSILVEALGATLPWTPLALAALFGPVRRWRRHRLGLRSEPTAPALTLAWWWAFAPLAVLGLWDVAKPSYYLPAVPAVAILAGAGWVRLAARAHDAARGLAARTSLQLLWSGLFAASLVAPVVIHELSPDWFGPAVVGGVALGLSTLLSARCWHLGRDSASLASLAVGLVALSLIGYGIFAPAENATRGHRDLTAHLTQSLPAGSTTWFFDDLDEALWFYGPSLNLQPVPPLQATASATASPTNRGHALRAAVIPGQARAEATAARTQAAVAQLAAWADQAGPGAYLLIRGKLRDRLGADLAPTLAPVFRETGVQRPELVLLRVRTPDEIADASAPTRR